MDQPYSPMTLGEKYLYSLNRVFGAPHLMLLAVKASFDQSEMAPAVWGGGADAFGVRMASQLGRSLVRQNIAFGVRALDHEDPRYFRLANGTGWQRVKHAMARTFVATNDDGKLMPAYSRFIADYSTPFIAQQWRPARLATVGLGLRTGSAGLGFAMGSNVAQEFWPDIRKALMASRLMRSPRMARFRQSEAFNRLVHQ